MKEDVLEQVVDDYLQSLGFLTRSNIRFRPSPAHPDYAGQADSGWGDIDVLGYSPKRFGADRVWVVSCKSWQAGLDPGRRLDQLVVGKEWHVHREVWVPKWGQALCDTVEQLTGQRAFRFFTAVTRLKGQIDRWPEWGQHPQVQSSLDGNWVGFLRLEDMWRRTLETSTTTLAGSVMGRLAQMLLAAGQAAVEEPVQELEPALTHPHEERDWSFRSLGGMWVPPPPAADFEDINRYGHTVDGYRYAAKYYGAEGDPSALRRLVDEASPRPRRSFELLRLEQFYDVRSWRFAGMYPDEPEDLERALGLHQAIGQAWASRRFDRQDAPVPHKSS